MSVKEEIQKARLSRSFLETDPKNANGPPKMRPGSYCLGVGVCWNQTCMQNGCGVHGVILCNVCVSLRIPEKVQNLSEE